MAKHNNQQNNQPKKITFENHRLMWRREEFLRDLFGIKDRTVKLNENDDVIRFLTQLRNIPEQRKLTVIGYGSLMNFSDIPRTAPNAEGHRLGILDGYERIFNIGWGTSFMNVRETLVEGAKMNVALIDIPFGDLPKLILREARYNFRVVQVWDTFSGTYIDALMVVGDSIWEDDALLPQLNYLHLCLSGAKYLDGLNGVRDFLTTTYCYSNKEHKHVTVDKWLKELDIIDYMFMHNYSSR